MANWTFTPLLKPENAAWTSLSSEQLIITSLIPFKRRLKQMGGQRIFCSTTPFLVGSRLASTRRQDNTNNETIKGKCFSKNEDENHSNKKFWLLCIGSVEVDWLNQYYCKRKIHCQIHNNKCKLVKAKRYMFHEGSYFIWQLKRLETYWTVLPGSIVKQCKHVLKEI